MAIPTGPSSRPRRRPADEGIATPAKPNSEPAKSNSEPAKPAEPARTAEPARAAEPVRPEAAKPAAASVVHDRPRRSESVRSSQRIPSEIFARDALLSPAVMALTVPEFFEVLYGDERNWQDVTIQDLFRMRDQAAWPDLFAAGDPRQLFTEDMCRRGQFVPIAWSAECLSFACSKDDAGQDELVRALDLLVQLPITVYSVAQDGVDNGISWLYRR